MGLFVIITSILYFGLKIYNHYNDIKNNDKAVEAVLNKKIDSLDNLKYFADNIPNLLEVSIGHALISEALYLGLENTIQAYLKRLAKW